MTLDNFGRTITDNGDGTYTCGGITVGQPSIEKALSTFNGMAPEGWIFPGDET